MRLSIDKIHATAKDRPGGYAEDVISRGVIDGDYLEITPEALAELRAIYRPKEEPPLPSLPTRIANLTGQVLQEALDVAQGVDPVTPEEAEKRIEICRSNVCGKWRASDETCSACGCYMKSKTPWRSAVCPVGLW